MLIKRVNAHCWGFYYCNLCCRIKCVQTTTTDPCFPYPMNSETVTDSPVSGLTLLVLIYFSVCQYLALWTLLVMSLVFFFLQLRQHFCSTCKYYLKKRNFYHIQLLISYANVFTVYCLCQINRMLFSHFYLYILVFATLNKKYQPFILTYFMWIKSLPCASCVKRSLLMNYSHWITETE